MCVVREKIKKDLNGEITVFIRRPRKIYISSLKNEDTTEQHKKRINDGGEFLRKSTKTIRAYLITNQKIQRECYCLQYKNFTKRRRRKENLPSGRNKDNLIKNLKIIVVPLKPQGTAREYIAAVCRKPIKWSGGQLQIQLTAVLLLKENDKSESVS